MRTLCDAPLTTQDSCAQAAIAILFADVMQRLLLKGAIDFAVRMQLPNHPSAMPTPQILPLGRKEVVRLLAWSSLGSVCTVGHRVCRADDCARPVTPSDMHCETLRLAVFHSPERSGHTTPEKML